MAAQLPCQLTRSPPSFSHDSDSSPPNDELPSSPPPFYLDKAEIQRLGRQRPAVLSSLLIEVGFITTIVTSMMMSEYFISGFNIVLPSITASLHIPNAERTWPAAVPNLTTAAFLLPFARLCDRFGGRNVFLAGHVWLLVWSLVSGFSQSPIMLIICRALQGIGFSAFLPAGLALLGQTYARPGPRKNLVYCLYGAFAVIGFYLGIIIGALADQWLNWRWYFYIGAIIEAAVLASGLLTIPRHLGDRTKGASMDWWGMATIVPGLLLVVYALTDGGNAPDGWKTPYIYVTLILGVVFLAAAVYVEGWKAKHPMLPPALFKPKYMKRLTLGLFCSYGVFGLFLFYASYQIETVLHIGPLQTAAWFAPLAVGGIMLALTGGFILHLVPNQILMIISGLGFLISVLLFAVEPEDADPSDPRFYWAWIFPAMCCGTIGVDITFNVSNVYITTAMPSHLQAAASGLINSILYLGYAFWLGVAEVAISVTQQVHYESQPHDGKSGDDEGGGWKQALAPREQYRIGFWVGVALGASALALTATVKMGQAEAAMTADEKAEMEKAAAQQETQRA